MTHTTGPVFAIDGTVTPTKVIGEYKIVNRNDTSNRAVYASGDLYTFLTSTRESARSFNFFDFFLPVNGGPPPHIHPFESEIWHVTDGQFQFNLGNQGTDSLVVPKGTTVFGPKDLTHGYRNLDSTATVIGKTPGARTLSMTVPGALDLFFDAAAKRVIDRNEEIPTFSGPTPDDFLNLGKFNARTNAGIILTALRPGYQPPADALDYILVLPEDAQGEVVDNAKSLIGKPGFQVYTTGNQEGIEKRPTVVGQFGINYTSLVNFTESGNQFSYNEFSLASQPSNPYPDQVVSDKNEIFYVEKGQLSLKIGDEEKTAGPETYVYIAPQTPYSIVNKGTETVEALAITVNPQEYQQKYLASQNTSNRPQVYQYQPDPLFPSPLNPLPSVKPNKIIHLSNNNDYFNESESDNPNTFRYLFDVSAGYSDFNLDPQKFNGLQYDGTFETATVNPSTNELVIDQGVFNVIDGQIGDDSQLHIIEILRYDYAEAGRKGVITQVYLPESQALSTVPDVVEELPTDTQAGLSTTDTIVVLPFDAPPTQYDFLVTPAEEFAFDVFRDKPKAEGGRPVPIVGEGWSVEGFESRRLIYAGKGDDEVYASKYDRVYGEQGNDILDASEGKGWNKLCGGQGSDTIILNVNDRGFGGAGDDFIDASVGIGLEGLDDKGHNLLDGGSGKDTLIAGSNDQLCGGSGNDKLYIRQGGNNLLYGGAGKDQFWIVSAGLPTDTVKVEYSDSAKSLLPAGLSYPELSDTRNTIMDFRLGVDKIYIQKVGDIVEFDDLQLLPTFSDLGSTSIIAKFTDGGIQKEISLANVRNIYFNEFTSNDFVFV
ncbi:cupin domain-containing protein [Calothrix sp. FACHB-1219]|uniref:cupin domain-containing protein n=1 Tax=unclassified Calothrix TaxID=2619626 RepID=UPI001683CF69|nr:MULTISPECIES: cupin domain-containing protein [unclassified Calothrix]MBD2203582.1 cupin domain-containing protein [Calothrix sp. FACHB-168]MBD2221193.1 cupin domain-containing protein [Calothrix sp. FACHB-1219]